MSNFSNVSTDNSTDSSSLQYVRTGTLLLCMSVGTFTNIIFIVTISKNRLLYRRSLFGLCLNLDCIFLLDIFLNQSLTVIASIRNSWHFSEPMCIAQSFSVHVVDTCLSLTLFMLGIDRLVAIRANVQNNAKHAKGLTRDSITLSILCLWLLSICFSIPLVTNTIPSVFIAAHFACLPQLNFNIIYTLSNVSLTIGIPIISVSAMYIHIAVTWYREKREITVHSQPSMTFQIETEVSNSVFTAVIHLIWIIMVGPYITWMYIPNLPINISTIVSWMRHFFSWIPFITMILYHKSFRNTFVTIFVGHKYRSSSGNVVIEPSNLNKTNACNSQHSFRTNIARNDGINNQISLFPDKDDEYSSATISRTSSVFSNRHIHHLPKYPILFADGSGVHVVHNSLSNTPSFSSSARNGATLCDIRQNSLTDTSDGISITTDGSCRQNNKLQRQSGDIDLPADISDMYNLDDPKSKRIKRRVQSQKRSFRNTLETAFETRLESKSDKKSYAPTDPTPNIPQRLVMLELRDSLMPSIKRPELTKGNNSQLSENPRKDGIFFDNASFVTDYIGSTNA